MQPGPHGLACAVKAPRAALAPLPRPLALGGSTVAWPAPHGASLPLQHQQGSRGGRMCASAASTPPPAADSNGSSASPALQPAAAITLVPPVVTPALPALETPSWLTPGMAPRAYSSHIKSDASLLQALANPPQRYAKGHHAILDSIVKICRTGDGLGDRMNPCTLVPFLLPCKRAPAQLLARTHVRVDAPACAPS